MDRETRYTPGPWVISKHCSTLVESSKGCRSICSAGGYSSNVTIELGTNEANANLIAAAPDLLEALERTLSWLTSYPGGGTLEPDGVYEQARKAIANAKGEL